MQTGAIAPAPNGRSRRLAAIAFADVVGYSGLMEADEQETHRRWRELRAQLIEPVIGFHEGRLVKDLGDGLLVEFRSVQEAVLWGIDVQQQLAGSALAGGHKRPLRLRIAVHLGDVISEGADIAGDGVNIAARLQEFSEPGGMVISSAVHDQVRHVLSYTARDLGDLALKNIKRPVHAFAISGPAGARALTVATPSAAARRPSIAVLPLRSLGTNPEDRYFAAGFACDVIATLASFRELFVVSSSSSLALSDDLADAGTAGARLGVRYLLTGSVAHTGNQLRIVTEFSDAETRSVIWTDRQEIRDSELFAVQSLIAGKIAYSLVPHLRNTELQRAMRKPPESLDAYDLVLKAMYRLYRIGERDFVLAQSLLEQALKLDPHYATAYALLAKCYILRVGEGYSHDIEAHTREAQRCAELALEEDSSDPLALAIYGHAMSFLFRKYEQAVEAFDRALTASPNSAVAWALSAPTYFYLGECAQAVTRAEYALRLSPLDPYAPFYQGILAMAHYINGTYEDSVRWGRKSMAANPNLTANLRNLIVALVAVGELDEARALARHMIELQPTFRVTPYIERYPLRDTERRKLFAEQLLAAGLPP
ncbi:MAG: adenylate/guanylate cyclase domain-containing protein [Alphaproteobacteria bacterium]